MIRIHLTIQELERLLKSAAERPEAWEWFPATEPLSAVKNEDHHVVLEFGEDPELS